MRPQWIGPYEVLGLLGVGGAGCVYRALDPHASAEVAVKLLSCSLVREPDSARRVLRELETLGELSHPNIVRIFDAGIHQDFPYLVMELIEGLTLRAYLELDRTGMPVMYRRPRRPPQNEATSNEPLFDLDRLAEEADTCETFLSGETTRLDAIDDPPTPADPETRIALARPERIALLKDTVLQICEALAFIHARGMVHRDLKPSNIMVDEDRRVRLMDFGLAKFLADDHEITQAGKIVGTYRFMAPEQILGEPVDGRTDLYALGAMMYELFVGRPIFEARTPLEMCRRILEAEPESLLELNPELDPDLARVIHRLLCKDPAERFQTAEEVSEVLAE